MSRDRSAPLVAADTAPHSGRAILLELLFASGPLRLCLGPWNIVAGGETYYATGAALQVDAHGENADGSEGLQFTMSGLDAAILALVISEPYHRRPVRMLEQRFSEANVAVEAPVAEFVGRMVSLVHERAATSNTATVTLVAEHFDNAARRPRDVRFTDAEQRRRFPGDLGAQYAAELVEKNLTRET